MQHGLPEARTVSPATDSLIECAIAAYRSGDRDTAIEILRVLPTAAANVVLTRLHSDVYNLIQHPSKRTEE